MASSEWVSGVLLFAIRYSPFASSTSFRLDDFRHGDAEFFFDQHDFAARDQAVVDVDVDRLADLAVELEHRTRSELEQLTDIHLGAAETCTGTSNTASRSSALREVSSGSCASATSSARGTTSGF